jgi:glycosyltransferase involved in cell wall biosynthesis
MALEQPDAAIVTPPGPVRIAFCITELDAGGAERSLVELVKRLDRQKFQTVVYCLGPRPPSNPRSLADELEECGVTVECLGARNVLHAPVIVWKVRRLLLRDRVAILQSFLFHANVLGTLAARWARVPIVLTGIRVAERRARWHLRLARWVESFVTCHVAVSQSVRDFSVREAGLPPQKVVVIPNGVDLERFENLSPVSRESLGVSASRHLVAFVGRLDEQKGAMWLLERMPDLLRRRDCQLIMIGDGPLREALARRSRDLGIAEYVSLIGWRDDVAQILAVSDLFVLPSRWEGMPNVLLEAMASGKPVVATAVEGVQEVLGPLAGDQMAAPEDIQGFVAKCVALLADQNRARVLGSQNRARVEEHFTLARAVSGYEALYAALWADRSAAAKVFSYGPQNANAAQV